MLKLFVVAIAVSLVSPATPVWAAKKSCAQICKQRCQGKGNACPSNCMTACTVGQDQGSRKK